MNIVEARHMNLNKMFSIANLKELNLFVESARCRQLNILDVFHDNQKNVLIGIE